jgi:hypothetical protein
LTREKISILNFLYINLNDDNLEESDAEVDNDDISLQESEEI